TNEGRTNASTRRQQRVQAPQRRRVGRSCSRQQQRALGEFSDVPEVLPPRGVLRQLEKSMLDAGGKVLARHQRPLFELDTAVVEGHAVEERAAVELRGALPLAITKR